jgi:DNA polymerase III delta prime subunit
LEEFLWVEKYRPSSVDELILPTELKSIFRGFVSDGVIPNMLLAGPPGVGKTSAARVMLDQLGCDYIFVNGSKEGNIETLRNRIQDFASAMSLSGGRKYVLIDEADYMNPNSFQPALRGFIEEFSVNTGFILTCNFKNRIIEPLHSRFAAIDFKIGPDDAQRLAGQFLKRLIGILDAESVKYDVPVLAEVINKYYPDWRRVINQVQAYSRVSGTLDSGILSLVRDDSVAEAIELMKAKDYTGLRKWVSDNSSTDQGVLFRRFYDSASEYFTQACIPQVILVLGKYLYQAAFAADAEINVMCCLTEILIEADFK